MVLRSSRGFRLFLGAAILLICGASRAEAQLAGVRVTLADVSQSEDSRTVDAEITATVFYGGSVAFSTAWMGYSVGFGALVPAVDWGDGSTVPPYYPTGIPFDRTSTPIGAPGPVRAYRMAFSHTYTSPGPFRITAYSNDVIVSPGYEFTGRVVRVPTTFYSIFGAYQTFVTNTARIPGIAPTEIPTVSDSGLLLLAAAMAGCGVFLLRR